MTCETCGQEHVTRFGGPACTGHANVRDDQDRIVGKRPCTKSPMHGQAKCGTHGGASPQAKAKAAQRVAEERAAAVLRRFGEPIDTTPTEALLDAVKWTAGYVAWLRAKVESARMDLALTQRSTLTGKREPSVWVELLGQWHDRLVRICAEAIKAGIEERRVRIAEQQGRLLADVIRGILTDLNLSAEQEAMVSDVVPRHLRAVAG